VPAFVDQKLKLTYDDLKEIPEGDPFRHEIIEESHIRGIPDPAAAEFRSPAFARGSLVYRFSTGAVEIDLTPVW